MLYAASHRARRRLLRLLLIVSASCLADVLASPTTTYDSYDSNHAGLLVRQGVETASSVREYHPLHLHHHHHLHHRNALSPSSSIEEQQLLGSAQEAAAGETLPVQQQLLAPGGDSVTRVPWYGLTELSDVLLLAVLVTCAVVGLLLLAVLVLGLRSKLQLFRVRHQQRPDGLLLSDYVAGEGECSAAKCSAVGGGCEKLQTKTPAPPIILVETGHVIVKPVPTTCVAVTVRDTSGGRETAYRSRRRLDQPLSPSDKRHPAESESSQTAAVAKGKRQSVPPSAVPLPSATMSATTVEPTNNSSQGTTVTTVTGNSPSDDKENCAQQHSEHQAQLVELTQQQQQHPSHPTSQRNVLKRQPVAEISLFGPPGTPGLTGSPTTFIQLLTPSSASSLSTSATTTDNNATPTKVGSAGPGGPGGPLSAAESMAAARFGFSPRSIHSFTVQTATYFRFPDVDDFTPTPRSVRSATKHHDATESSSTPPAVDACTEEEGGSANVVTSAERGTASPALPPVPPPVVKCDPAPPTSDASQPEPTGTAEEVAKQPDAPPPEREPRAAHRICAPMANRRVRLKSISLDSEGARLVEENLTSTIPVQELVGMAQQRSTGRFDEDDNDDDEDDDEDDDDENDHNDGRHGNRNETDDGVAKRAKRVRNILNLRLNIPPPAATATVPLAPPGASQSTGSMVKAPRTMVTVSGSISNPTMSSTNTTTNPPHHQHGMMAVLGGGGGGPGGVQMDESNEQFYFEYYDYGDDDTDEDDEYDVEEYVEHEDNNNNSMMTGAGGHGRMGVAVSLPPAPKTPTLSQSKQKANSLDSDKLRLTTMAAVPYGGSGSVGSGAPGGSVSCSGGMSHILSIAQSTSGHSMSTLSYSNHHSTKEQRQQHHQTSQQQLQLSQFQHHQQSGAGQLQQPPRRVSSVSVPTTPKRYQYRTAANHHYHHHHQQQQQQQQQQQYAASGQSKLKPSYHSGTAMAGGGEPSANGNRKDKSPVGHKGTTVDASHERTITTSSEDTTTTAKDVSSTPAKVPTSGRSSILQRRGSNHSLTLNLDVYPRGGSVDLTSSSCSLYRGSYKNLHQVQSHSQLYQQYPDGGSTVRVQCHQASPQQQQQQQQQQQPQQQQQGGLPSSGQMVGNTSGGSTSNVNNNNATSKKNLLQRRGSNTSLTLNLRSGLGAGAGGGGGGGGGGCGGGGGVGGSAFGLNRFSSHNSLNMTHMSTLGTINSSAMGGSVSGTGISTGGQHHSSSLVRPAGSRKSLLERRNSNASLTLINVNQRTLSVSNCNLRGSICSLNSLLTTHTQNEPSGMMLEEDELDCTGAGNGGEGEHDHHHGGYHHHNHHNPHHHHQHHQHHGGHCHQHHGGGCGAHGGGSHGTHHRGGGDGELRRFGSSMDAGMAGGNEGAGVDARGGRSANYGRLTVATTHGTSMDQSSSSTGGQQHGGGLEDSVGRAGGAPCAERHHHAMTARQRKFRSSDSLHNINSLREHGMHGCERQQLGHGAMERHQQTDAKLSMSVSNYQRSCQSSFDDRHHFGSSENVKEHQNKLSTHRGLFQRDPATVTSTSSANNLSALGTGNLCNCCCCCCCCCCGGGGGGGGGGPMDGGSCCDESGLIVKTGNLSISNSNIRNISTKPLSPQTTSEDFKIYLANIQFLQNASNVLTIAYLRKLHNFFSKTYRQMLGNAQGAGQPPRPSKEQQDGADQQGGPPKMMLLHSDSLHHPPVCDDEAYDEEHKKMVLKIHQEFWDLPTNYQEKPLVFGSQAKNRYKTILPNEHSRVILEAERALAPAGEPYINANYIKGPDYSSNCYIATQGPLPNTIYEFWMMVQQNIVRAATASPASPSSPTAATDQPQKIVMLTNFVENGRQKCAIYFPQDEGDWLAFGSTADVDVADVLEHKHQLAVGVERAEHTPIKLHCASGFFLVHNQGVEQRNGYTVRTLRVIYGARREAITVPAVTGGSKTGSVDHGDEGDEFELTSFRAHHYWFPDWPDHRSPNDINVLLDLSLDVLGANGASPPMFARTDRDGSCKEVPAETTSCVAESCVSPVSGSSSSRTAAYGCTVLPIVHCSAGIGRTGCLIAILNGLRQLRLSVMAHTKRKLQQQQQLLLHPQSEQICYTPPADIDGAKPRKDCARKAIESDDCLAVEQLPDPLPDDDDPQQRFPLPPVPGGSVESRFNGRGPPLSGAHRGESGQVDILGIVCNLRLQRGGMVQNSEQYELIHRALCLYLDKLTQEGHI